MKPLPVATKVILIIAVLLFFALFVFVAKIVLSKIHPLILFALMVLLFSWLGNYFWSIERRQSYIARFRQNKLRVECEARDRRLIESKDSVKKALGI